jgi:hypothetical protein
MKLINFFPVKTVFIVNGAGTGSRTGAGKGTVTFQKSDPGNVINSYSFSNMNRISSLSPCLR